MNKKHVVIIGGGISGLSAAFFLSRRASREHLPVEITVLEASPRFGGVLRTLTQGDLRMEAGADAFDAGPSDAADLCRDLGLREDLVEAPLCFRHFFGLKGKTLYPVPGLPGSFSEAVPFLKDPRLSFSAKCRLLAEPFIPRRKEEGDESFAGFIRRRLGERFYQAVAKPLVQGVYMMDPERLSLEALFPRLWRIEKTYGSLIGSFLYGANEKKGEAERSLTLRHGLESLVRALVRSLEGCVLRRSAPVRECAYRSGWEIFLEDGAVLKADILGLAMNACDSSKLLSRTAPGLSRELSGISYAPIATVGLIYKAGDVPVRGLGPGFLVPWGGERYPFSSLKCLGKSADGKYVLMRAFLPGALDPGSSHESDAALRQKVLVFLNDSLGIRAEPLFLSVERYPQALPYYEIGHLERVRKIEERMRACPGLFLAGNGFRGFGITECVRQARVAVSGLPLS